MADESSHGVGVGSRILVVDDNVDSAETMARLSELSGHEVQIAHDGPQAIAAARRWRPEFVLLDIGLPAMDGYEVARRLRQEAAVCVTLVGGTGDQLCEKSRLQKASHWPFSLR